jgi:hypothetical protein
MRQQLIFTTALIFLAGLVFCIKNIYYRNVSSETAFYFQLVLWISGLLAGFLGLNLLWQYRKNRTAEPDQKQKQLKWNNRRQSFRLVYPGSQRPRLIVERVDNQPIRHLEYPVADISEGGLSFIDDGSLGKEDTLSGRLVFKQGEQFRVNGHILRREGSRICVQFRRSLAWSTILKEQRKFMSQSK